MYKESSDNLFSYIYETTICKKVKPYKTGHYVTKCAQSILRRHYTYNV